MAYDKVVDSEKLDGAIKATADAIREKTGTSDQIEWDKNNGFKDSVEGVFNAGKKAEYEAFWNKVVQWTFPYNEGTYRFAGSCWNDDTLKPPQKITITKNCNGCFYACKATDIRPYIEFVEVTNFNNAFSYGKVKKVPHIDVSNLSNSILSSSFANSEVELIEGLTVSELTKFSNTFSNAPYLVHVIFYGTIAQNGLTLSGCERLDKESIVSIINALSTETSGLSVTFAGNAVANAFGGTSSSEWLALIGTRSNWTISLVGWTEIQ